MIERGAPMLHKLDSAILERISDLESTIRPSTVRFAGAWL